MSKDVSFDELIGANGALRGACDRAKIAADSGVSVFLWGEPGVGKETLARAIAGAFRPFRKFLPLDGRTVPWRSWERLISSTDEDVVVFLDGAERIPRQVGRNLASAILSGKVKFQTVFSSTKPCQTLASASNFSSELATLFGAFPIFLPPLRERTHDFDALAVRFFADATAEARVLRDPLTPDELTQLRASSKQLRSATFSREPPPNSRRSFRRSRRSRRFRRLLPFQPRERRRAKNQTATLRSFSLSIRR